MSNKHDTILRALKRANAIDPNRLLIDEIDTVANQLDFMLPPGVEPTDKDADEAVVKAVECKKRHAELQKARKAEKERLKKEGGK